VCSVFGLFCFRSGVGVFLLGRGRRLRLTGGLVSLFGISEVFWGRRLSLEFGFFFCSGRFWRKFPFRRAALLFARGLSISDSVSSQPMTAFAVAPALGPNGSAGIGAMRSLSFFPPLRLAFSLRFCVLVSRHVVTFSPFCRSLAPFVGYLLRLLFPFCRCFVGVSAVLSPSLSPSGHLSFVCFLKCFSSWPLVHGPVFFTLHFCLCESAL